MNTRASTLVGTSIKLFPLKLQYLCTIIHHYHSSECILLCLGAHARSGAYGTLFVCLFVCLFVPVISGLPVEFKRK